MKRVRAVASGLYDSEGGTVLTTSIVGGTTKRNLRVEESKREKVDMHSVHSIQAAFRGLIEKVCHTAELQKNDAPGMHLPFVFGSTELQHLGDVIMPVRDAFKTIFDSPIFMHLNGMDASFSRIHWSKVSRKKAYQVVMDMMDTILHVVNIKKHQRAEIVLEPGILQPFAKEHSQPSSGDAIFMQAHHRTVNALLLRWKADAEKGDAKALDDLRMYAKNKAQKLIEDNPDIEILESRFLLIQDATDPAMRELPKERFLEWFDLRQVYAKEVIRLSRLQNHICVKSKKDPKNNAFVDIAGTLIADELNKVSGNTELTAVMVQPQE